MPRTALFLALFALSSVDAWAHAPPYATGIGFHVTSAGERSMIRTNRGLIVGSPEQGFRLVCNDAFRASLVETVPVAELAGGDLLVGTYAGGLLRSDAALCDFDAVGPDQVSPVDVAGGAGGLVRALLLPLDGSDGGLFESVDGGASFERLAPVGTAPTALVTAPSDPERVYVSTTTTEESRSIGHVLVSQDGGRHFTDRVLELDATELRTYVLAVDASDPARLFVRTESRDGIAPERLLLSEDAGETFRRVLTTEGPITLTFGDAGQVWAGSATGLYRSRDRGASFEPLENAGLTRVSCLAVHGGRLYACALRSLEFGVLVSGDAGATFQWFLRFPAVTARATCPTTSDEGSRCEVAFEDWTLEQLVPSAGPAPAVAGPAADPPPASEEGERGGGCRTSAPGRPGAELVFAVLLGSWLRRRWKRHA
jgi:hypothetical protein